jgi:hypothetical protein
MKKRFSCSTASLSFLSFFLKIYICTYIFWILLLLLLLLLLLPSFTRSHTSCLIILYPIVSYCIVSLYEYLSGSFPRKKNHNTTSNNNNNNNPKSGLPKSNPSHSHHHYCSQKPTSYFPFVEEKTDWSVF